MEYPKTRLARYLLFEGGSLAGWALFLSFLLPPVATVLSIIGIVRYFRKDSDVIGRFIFALVIQLLLYGGIALAIYINIR